MTLTIHQAGVDDSREYVRALVAGSDALNLTRFSLTAENVLTADTGACRDVLVKAQARFVEIEREDDLYNLKVALEGTADERQERLGFSVDTLVINRLDELQRVMLKNRMSKDRRLEMNNEDWNWITERLNAIFAGLDELEVNIIVITGVTHIGETLAVKPSIIGNFSTQVHNYVDYAFLFNSWTPTALDVLIETLGTDEEEEIQPLEQTYYLQTEASPEAEWVHDYTQELPKFIDLNFESDFATIVESRNTFRENLVESTAIVLEDSVEEIIDEEVVISVDEVITPDSDTKDQNVPGMSTADQIAKILKG